jgi:hypothetical protein
VVENARRVIGRTIDISVTSVLQTTAGKMIFGRYEEGRGGERNDRERSGSHYSGGSRGQGGGSRRSGRHSTVGNRPHNGPNSER